MTCRQCGTTVPEGYGVTLGRRHGFCGRACLAKWAPDRVLFLEAEMNRIFIRSRGRARTLAREALVGNVPSTRGKQ